MAVPDKQKKVMSGDPADTDTVAALKNNPFLAPMFGAQADEATPGAGADGQNNGTSAPASVRGGSEQSSEPQTDATASNTPPANVPAMFTGLGAPKPSVNPSTADLEDRAAASTPGAAVASQRPSFGQRAAGIGMNLLARLGNAGYAIAGGDPREMRLKEQGEQFEEEQQRMKADPNYQARVAAATTAPDVVTSPNAGGGYQYTRIDKFSGAATPTGVAAPSPEKSPAQVLNEFVQQYPDALQQGTPNNSRFRELAASMRAFPSDQATIRANAEMYVGRMGVQRAIIQADGLIKAMQGRGVTEMATQQAQALNEQLKAAAQGWEQFYVEHPYLQAMGIGPDAAGQAQFMAGVIEQLKSIGLEANQTVQKIPGAGQIVPKKKPQIPIIGAAANAAGGPDSFVQKHSRH